MRSTILPASLLTAWAATVLLFSSPVYALNLQFVGELGNGPGSAPGQFNQPTDIRVADVDRDGLADVVFVADTGNNRIQMFSSSPTEQWSVIAAAGTAPGQVSAPQGLAYDEFNDILYVADTGNNRVQVLPTGLTTPAGPPPAIVAAPGTALGEVNAPQGLAYDEFNDILYIADTGNNRVQGGSVDDGVIHTFIWTQLGGPGTGPGQFGSPSGLAVGDFDRDGIPDLAVADTGNNRIQTLTNNPADPWSIIAGPGNGLGEVTAPEGLDYDEFNDVLYIADTSNNRVQAATASVDIGGNLNWDFQGGSTISGKLIGIEIVAASNHTVRVYVADTGNNRILIFQAVPEPSTALLGGLAMAAGLAFHRRRCSG